MSETLDDLNDLVTDRLPATGDPITNLRTGLPFTAEVEPIADVELNTELGRDAREAVILHSQDRVSAMAVKMGSDLLRVTLLGTVVTLQAIRRTANPANPMVDLGCMIVTTKDS